MEALLDMLDEMVDGGIALPYVYHIGDPNGVPFSTVHSAKGLEWRKVFMIACSAKNWSGKSNNRGYKLPDTLLPGTSDEGQQAEEDERRLFFVGMTRAKEELFISYAKDQRNANSTGKSTQDLACKFMIELQDRAGMNIQTMSTGTAEKESVLETLLHPLDSNPGQLEEAWLSEQVSNFVMSVTALNKYLSCPRAFYYENILRVPAARNRFMGYGSAVHAALEHLFRANPGLTDDVAVQLVTYFERSLHQYRSHFTETEFRNTLEHGRQKLPGYVETLLPEWRKAQAVQLEKDIRNVEWEGFPIKGKLDKIEIFPDGISIVDYKTGSPERGMQKLKAPDPSNPYDPGGDYWRQIVFYEMLVRADKTSGWRVRSSVMEFVEPNSRGHYERRSLEVTEEDIHTVTAQMAEAYEGIRKLAFSRGCHDDRCTWCNLLDRHVLPDSLTPGGAGIDPEAYDD
jgi:DNA helicase-2/ATP-dependent DNA helicase PcrA